MLHAPGLKGLIIFLVVAGIIVPLFYRARISTVLGFLIAGVLLGPHALGQLVPDYPWVRYITFDEPSRAEALAEFGIVILLFLLGLELSLKRLWDLRRYVLGVGLAQVVLTTIAIGVTVRIAGGLPPAGIVLGLCFALSSTAIVMQLLNEQHRTAHPIGRIALSVLLLQDMMVVPILFIVGILAGGEKGSIFDLIVPFAQALGVVFAIMLLGRFIAGPLLHSAVRTGSRDLIIAITLLILVVFSVATGLAGLSVALGAFLAGLLLSDSEARHQIEVDLEPFKDLLLGIFFITVGASLDLGAVATHLHWVVAGAVVLMILKATILFGIARAFGISRGNAIEVGLLLSQAGEFAFVVLAHAQAVLRPELTAGAVAVAGLSMLLTPAAARAARFMAKSAENIDHRGHAPSGDIGEMKDHVVIGGCGRVGQIVADALAAEGVPFVCMDTNADMVVTLRRAGKSAFYGDASRAELLHRIGGQNARAFVVTLNEAKAAERMVTAARSINARALIFARAKNHTHAARMVKRGAIGVIPETVEASLQLAGRVLESLDLPDDAVLARVAELRAVEMERLDRAEMER